ncbi:MAG: hypothetical protein VX777_04725 [Chlamydiota bacterium]|nr:hypothetical protein [Chlamydiota bacterium]
MSCISSTYSINSINQGGCSPQPKPSELIRNGCKNLNKLFPRTPTQRPSKPKQTPQKVSFGKTPCISAPNMTEVAKVLFKG